MIFQFDLNFVLLRWEKSNYGTVFASISIREFKIVVAIIIYPARNPFNGTTIIRVLEN